MSDHRQPVPSDRARLEASDTLVVPGRPAWVVVRLTNVGATSCGFTVELIGAPGTEPSAVASVPDLAGGATVEMELPVELPTGFPPSRQLVGVAATPDDGSDPVRTQLHLVIAGGEGLVAELDPPIVRGRGTTRFRVALRNDGHDPVTVTLAGLAPQGGLDLDLPDGPIELAPGQSTRVLGRVSGKTSPTGHGQRLPFGVRVDGAAAPIHLEGGYAQRAFVPISGVKAVGILVVVALWIAGLGIGLNRITNDDDDGGTQIAEGSPAPGGSDGGGADAGGGAAGGADGAAQEGIGGATPIAEVARIGGTVDAPDPSGVTVRLEPVPLASEDTAGAEPLGFRRGAAAGKLLAAPTDSQQLGGTRSVITDPTGQWAFGGLRAPAYYLVTFSKPGYGSRSNVVQVKEDAEPVVVDVLLQPGDGSASGSVVGPDGPLGDVDIVVSDGTVTLTTRTPSEGEGVGTWALDALPAPGTFLVTASRDGFGTQTALVEVGAGGTSDPVSLRMASGVGTISGTALTTLGGVGNLTVTLQDVEGNQVREATTLTEGQVGSFALPDLEIPGEYLVTVRGTNYVTSTQQVSLAGNTSIQVPMERTTGEITGLVREVTSSGSGPFLANVGVTVRSDEGARYATTSADTPPGEYSLIGVPPGTYVVTFDRFGYESSSALITLARGQQLTLPTTELVKLDAAVLEGEGSISGLVTALDTKIPIDDVAVRVVERPDLLAVTVEGGYTITGVPPGTYNLQFDSDPGSAGFQQVRTRIVVPFNGAAKVKTMRMAPLASLTIAVGSAARVPSNVYNLPIEGATVRLTGQDTRWVLDEATGEFTRETVEVVLPAGGEAPIRIDRSGQVVLDRRLPTDPVTGSSTYTLAVSRPGFQTKVIQNVKVADSSNNHQQVLLDQDPILAVGAWRPSGAGTAPVLADIEVRESIEGAAHASARSVGAVQVYDGTSGLIDGQRVDIDAAVADGSNGSQRSVLLTQNVVTEVGVTLIPTFDQGLIGTVAWADAPLPDDTLLANFPLKIKGVYDFDDGSPGAATTRDVMTNGAGAFTIPAGDLPPGGVATLEVAATTSFKSRSVPVDFSSLIDDDPDTAPGPIPILLEAVPQALGGRIDTHSPEAGPVIDASGIGIQATAAPRPQPLGKLKTAVMADGRFQIYDPDVSAPNAPCATEIDSAKCKVRPGHYTLQFAASAFVVQDSADVEDGKTTVAVVPGTANTSVNVGVWKYGSATLLIKDPVTGAVPPGAKFLIESQSTVVGSSVSTLLEGNGSGALVVPDLVPGEYRFRAGLVGWKPPETQPGGCTDYPESVCFTVESGAMSTPTTFDLSQRGVLTGTVQGRLLGAFSSIGAAVKVTATGPSGTVTGLADPDSGVFELVGTELEPVFGLQAGDYIVTIASADTPPGFAPYSPPVTVPVGVGSATVPPLVLESLPATLTGHIVERLGESNQLFLDDVDITVYLPGGTTVTGKTGVNPNNPNDHGWFSIPNLPAVNVTVSLSKEGYNSPLTFLVNGLTRGGTLAISQEMTSPRVTLGVTVTGAFHTGTGGSPAVVGAEVRAVRTDVAGIADIVGTTESDGIARLAIQVSARYRIEAHADGFLEPPVSSFPTLQPPQLSRVTANISLVPVRRPVEVTVESAVSGADVPDGLAVDLTADADGTGETAAGGSTVDGVAEISSVLPGRYTLVVTGSGGRGSYSGEVVVPLDPGRSEDPSAVTTFETSATLQEARVTGTLSVDDNGESPPATSAKVTLVEVTGASGSGQTATVALSDDGDGKQAGDYTFFVDAAGSYELTAEVDVPPGVHDQAASGSFSVAIGEEVDRGLSTSRVGTPPSSTTTTAAAPTSTTTPTPTSSSSTTAPPEPPP